jgi:hypothetical protein
MTMQMSLNELLSGDMIDGMLADIPMDVVHVAEGICDYAKKIDR